MMHRQRLSLPVQQPRSVSSEIWPRKTHHPLRSHGWRQRRRPVALLLLALALLLLLFLLGYIPTLVRFFYELGMLPGIRSSGSIVPASLMARQVPSLAASLDRLVESHRALQIRHAESVLDGYGADAAFAQKLFVESPLRPKPPLIFGFLTRDEAERSLAFTLRSVARYACELHPVYSTQLWILDSGVAASIARNLRNMQCEQDAKHPFSNFAEQGAFVPEPMSEPSQQGGAPCENGDEGRVCRIAFFREHQRRFLRDVVIRYSQATTEWIAAQLPAEDWRNGVSAELSAGLVSLGTVVLLDGDMASYPSSESLLVALLKTTKLGNPEVAPSMGGLEGLHDDHKAADVDTDPWDAICSNGRTNLGLTFYDSFATVVSKDETRIQQSWLDRWVNPTMRLTESGDWHLHGSMTNDVSQMSSGVLTLRELDPSLVPPKTYHMRSCFGGLTVYRAATYLEIDLKEMNDGDGKDARLQCSYAVPPAPGFECEHTTLHICLGTLQTGFRLGLLTNLATRWHHDKPTSSDDSEAVIEGTEDVIQVI